MSSESWDNGNNCFYFYDTSQFLKQARLYFSCESLNSPVGQAGLIFLVLLPEAETETQRMHMICLPMVTEPQKAEVGPHPHPIPSLPAPEPMFLAPDPAPPQQPQVNRVTEKVSSSIPATWLNSKFTGSEAECRKSWDFNKTGNRSTPKPRKQNRPVQGPLTGPLQLPAAAGRGGAGAGVLTSPRIIDECVSAGRGEEIKASCRGGRWSQGVRGLHTLPPLPPTAWTLPLSLVGSFPERELQFQEREGWTGRGWGGGLSSCQSLQNQRLLQLCSQSMQGLKFPLPLGKAEGP